MWEITLSINKKNAEQIDYIFEQVSPIVKGLKGVCIKHIIHGRAKLSLAVESENTVFIKSLLSKCVANAVVEVYKYEYMKENLKLPISNELTKNALVKALAVFDKAEDIEYIEKRISFGSEFLIDSFYHFCLGELRERWDDVIALMGDNSGGLMLTDSFLDLVKFLIKTTEPMVNEIHIKKNDNDEIYFCDEHNNKIVNKATISKNEEMCINVINELIELSPKNIIIDKTDIKDETLIDNIQNIFDDKVQIILSSH